MITTLAAPAADPRPFQVGDLVRITLEDGYAPPEGLVLEGRIIGIRIYPYTRIAVTDRRYTILEGYTGATIVALTDDLTGAASWERRRIELIEAVRPEEAGYVHDIGYAEALAYDEDGERPTAAVPCSHTDAHHGVAGSDLVACDECGATWTRSTVTPHRASSQAGLASITPALVQLDQAEEAATRAVEQALDRVDIAAVLARHRLPLGGDACSCDEWLGEGLDYFESLRDHRAHLADVLRAAILRAVTA